MTSTATPLPNLFTKKMENKEVEVRRECRYSILISLDILQIVGSKFHVLYLTESVQKRIFFTSTATALTILFTKIKNGKNKEYIFDHLKPPFERYISFSQNIPSLIHKGSYRNRNTFCVVFI